MTRRPSKSEAQANAEALVRRSAPYSQSHSASVAFSWDYRAHIPDDLRGLVRAARRAYEDEVPTKLHESELSDDGTPRMTNAATSYIFGSPNADDNDKLPHYVTPFRATLDRMERGDIHRKRRAAIVRHITIGGQEPVMAAIMEEAHPLDARLVAEDALRVFLNGMSDVKIDTRPEAAA